METTFNLIAYILLIGAVVLCLISLWKPNQYFERFSFYLIVLAFVALTLALADRSLAIGRLPFATLYEFTFLFAWGILLFYVIARRHIKSALLSSLVSVCTVLLVSYGSTLPSEAKPLMPALQSIWLEAHVITAVIAYGAFGLSFCIAIAYLLKDKNHSKGFAASLPPLKKLDSLMHWSVVVGFPFMTLVLITGSVWAEEVWGNWWSWDPKETWALVTWLIYAGYLHAHKTYGWQGKKAALIAVIGFLAVLFTLFGVTLLLTGAHSYV